MADQQEQAVLRLTTISSELLVRPPTVSKEDRRMSKAMSTMTGLNNSELTVMKQRQISPGLVRAVDHVLPFYIVNSLLVTMAMEIYIRNIFFLTTDSEERSLPWFLVFELVCGVAFAIEAAARVAALKTFVVKSRSTSTDLLCVILQLVLLGVALRCWLVPFSSSSDEEGHGETEQTQHLLFTANNFYSQLHSVFMIFLCWVRLLVRPFSRQFTSNLGCLGGEQGLKISIESLQNNLSLLPDITVAQHQAMVSQIVMICGTGRGFMGADEFLLFLKKALPHRPAMMTAADFVAHLDKITLGSGGDLYGPFSVIISTFRHWAGQTWELFFTFILILITSALPPLQSYLITYITNNALDMTSSSSSPMSEGAYESAKSALQLGIIGLIAICIPNLIGILVMGYLQAKISGDATLKLQMRLTRGLLSMGTQYYMENSEGEINNLLSADVARVNSLWQSIFWNFMNPAFNTILALLYIASTDWFQGVVGFFFVTIILTGGPHEYAALKSKEFAARSAYQAAEFQNGIECRRVIAAFRALEHYLEQIFIVSSDVRTSLISSQTWASVLQAYVSSLVFAYVVFQIAATAYMIFVSKEDGGKSTMSVGEFAGLIALYQNLANPVTNLGRFMRSAIFYAGSLERLDRALEETKNVVTFSSSSSDPGAGGASGSSKDDDVKGEKPEESEKQETSITTSSHSDDGSEEGRGLAAAGKHQLRTENEGKRRAKSFVRRYFLCRRATPSTPSSSFQDSEEARRKLPDLPPMAESFALKNIRFRYPNSPEETLKGLWLEFAKGTYNCIVGASGGGKTTVLNLLLGFEEAQEGAITMDGKDIKNFSPSSYFRQIGVVFQSVRLLNGSIMDNIRYGNLEASDEECMAAAQAAECHDFIMTLKEKYDTVVGQHATSSLSGGQAQRICLARALCRQPKLLFLDEATSALDPETEHAVVQTFSRLKREYGMTIVSITHRLQTTLNADKVFVLKSGTLAESGTYDELLKANGYFAEMTSLKDKKEIDSLGASCKSLPKPGKRGSAMTSTKADEEEETKTQATRELSCKSMASPSPCHGLSRLTTLLLQRADESELLSDNVSLSSLTVSEEHRPSLLSSLVLARVAEAADDAAFVKPPKRENSASNPSLKQTGRRGRKARTSSFWASLGIGGDEASVREEEKSVQGLRAPRKGAPPQELDGGRGFTSKLGKPFRRMTMAAGRNTSFRRRSAGATSTASELQYDEQDIEVLVEDPRTAPRPTQTREEAAPASEETARGGPGPSAAGPHQDKEKKKPFWNLKQRSLMNFSRPSSIEVSVGVSAAEAVNEQNNLVVVVESPTACSSPGVARTDNATSNGGEEIRDEDGRREDIAPSDISAGGEVQQPTAEQAHTGEGAVNHENPTEQHE